MTTFYFTSTGNCLYAAKEIGGECVSIPQAMQAETTVWEDDAIGLVFPVYGLSVPPIVLEFLDKVQLKSKYLFAVLAFGTYDAGAAAQLAAAAAEKGEKFTYLNTLHTQENYLPGYAMEKQHTPAQQEEKLAAICRDIAARREWCKPNSGFDRFMTWTHQKNYHFARGTGITEKVQVTDQCIGCGICTRVCPAGNIKIENELPAFGQDCLSCLACVQNCPNHALHLSTEKSGERYRNAEITLEELIHANDRTGAGKTKKCG